MNEELEDRVAELEGRVAALERAFVARVGAPATRTVSDEERQERAQRAFDLLEGAMDLWCKRGGKHD